MQTQQDPREFIAQLRLPAPTSHKGQNGKVMIIGGSELFHSASKWSLDIASKCADMVFYASVPENIALIREAKSEFWNGIVIPLAEVEAYIEEADSVLIGPGMTRTQDTAEITNYLLTRYSSKKWVLDAGALQMVDVSHITTSCILTPHRRELEMLVARLPQFTHTTLPSTEDIAALQSYIQEVSGQLQSCTLVYKSHIDIVATATQSIIITGGHPGMTKGGTGDVLAGLIAGLYATQPQMVSAVVGSYINKKAGEHLADKVGPFFNSSDLVNVIPEVLWQEIQDL